MKSCDLINEQPVIPKGEQSCLYGNLVYVKVEKEHEIPDVAVFFFTLALFLWSIGALVKYLDG